MRWSRRSRNWTSFSSPWARAWDGHEVVDLAKAAWVFHDGGTPTRSAGLVGVTATGPDRVDAAATSRSRPRGASFFHYRPNGARRAHRRPTALQVSRRRRATARLCWVALANRRGRARE